MISGWWLVIIIPLSMILGIAGTALCVAASRRDRIDS